MAAAGSLIFELAADVAHLRQDMQKANDTIVGSLKSIQKSVRATAIFQGIEFAKGFAQGFANNIMAVVDQADALNKLSERIGTTVENLSGLKYAADLSNVSIEDLTVGFKGLAKAFIDSKDPGSKAAAAFKAIGLEADKLRTMDPTKAFEEIAQAMSGFQDGAEKAAIAQELFGKQGAALIPLLNTGKGGIEDMRVEAEKLGLIVSGNTAKAMTDLKDNLTRLDNVAKGAWATIAQQLVPAFDTLIKSLFDATQEGSGTKDIFVGIGVIIADLILDITSFAGEIRIVWRELQGYSQAVKTFFAGEFKAAWEQTKQAARESIDAQQKLNEEIQKAKELTRNPIDFGKGPENWVVDDKPQIKWAGGADKAAKAAKGAKAGIDEYKQMLDSLNEELRRAAANGDEMQLLLTDPKMLKFSQQQQETLRGVKEAYLALTEAQKAAKQAEEDQLSIAKAADDAHVSRIEGLRNLAESTKDQLDPTREYIRVMSDLVEAQKAGFLSTQQLADAQAIHAEKLQASLEKLKPLNDQINDLKDAILGWSKQASDTFVDFISGAEKSSKSFGEMTASILRDIAKMLIHKNFLEPLFKGIGGGGWGGFLGGIGGFGGLAYGGARMAGGPVSAGQVYRVGESAFAREYFAPRMAGNIVKEGGADKPMNVYVTINQERGTAEGTGDTANAIELAKRMAMVARQVIATEKRVGGLLAQGA